MGVRIDGSNDVVSAADGSLTVDGLSLSVTGIITASGGFKVGSAYTAYSNGNVETTGIVTTSGGLRVSSGNLGVRVASPDHNLDVYLTGRLNQLGQGGHGLLVGPGSNTGGFTYMSTGDIEISTAQTTKDIVFSDAVGGNERMRLTGDTGRLGIGTNSPGANLHVQGATGGAGQIYLTDGDADGITNSFLISKGGTTTTLKDRQASSNLDFGTADTIAMRIDSSQRLLVGTTSARSVSSLNSSLQVEGTGGDSSTISVTRNVDSAAPPRVCLAKSRGTSVGSNIVVESDDSLGEISFSGADGTDANSVAATINCKVDGTPGSNDMPGRIMFHTTADGAASPTERMRIGSDNKVYFGSFVSAGAAGFIEKATDGDYEMNIVASRSTTQNRDFRFFSRTSVEAMRLNASGQLQLGGSSDLGSQLLQIHGDSDAASDVIISRSGANSGQTATLTFAPANNITGGRIQCVAEEDFSTGANRTARLAFFIRKDGTLEEKMRLTSDGALQIGSSGSGSLTNNVLYESLRIGNGLIKKYYVIDTLDNGQKTRFTFTGTNRTSAIITIMASGSWTASNTANNHPAAQFISRVMTDSSGDSTDSSTVTAPFAYVFSTSNYAFNNAGSFGYSIDIANPTGDSGVTFSYEVTVQSAVASSQHALASTTTA